MLTLLGATAPAATSTFCNPINIDYRFSFDRPSHREAADPTMVVHGSTYWLFPSKSGGYWHSEDMNEWTFVEPTGLPIETYAPMVVVLGELWYWTAFNAKAIFRTEVRQSDLTLTEVRQSNPNPTPNPNPNQDPKTGNWTRVADLNAYPDPGMLVDDDGRVFMYYGCSDDGPISAVELNSSTWREIGAPVVALRPNSSERGFEQGGDNNELRGKTPYVEGAWMSKLGGRQ